MTYFFSGIKHSGKSTHAKLFANYKSLPFYDLDDEIINNISYSSIREFYKKEGKEAFMNMEYTCLKSLIQREKGDKVIALGGGICDNKKAFDLCTNLIYLSVDENVLYNRILKSGIPPFLKENPEQQFHLLYKNRDSLYKEKASLIIKIKDGDVESVFKTILTSINNWGE